MLLTKDIWRLLFQQHFDEDTLFVCRSVCKWMNEAIPLEKVHGARVNHALQAFRARQLRHFARELREYHKCRKVAKRKEKKAVDFCDFCANFKHNPKGEQPERRMKLRLRQKYERCPHCNLIFKTTKMETHVGYCAKNVSCNERQCPAATFTRRNHPVSHRRSYHDCKYFKQCGACGCAFPHSQNSPHKRLACPLNFASCRGCGIGGSRIAIGFHERDCSRFLSGEQTWTAFPNSQAQHFQELVWRNPSLFFLNPN